MHFIQTITKYIHIYIIIYIQKKILILIFIYQYPGFIELFTLEILSADLFSKLE